MPTTFLQKLSANATYQRFLGFANWPMAIILAILTYCAPSFVTAPGIDASYMWAINHLWVFDRSALAEMVYPIGPLGFLLHPQDIGHNAAWSVWFLFLVGILFYALLLRSASQNWSVMAWLVAYFTGLYAPLTTTIPMSVALACWLSYHKKEHWLLLPLSLFASLAFFIKSSIGISAASVLFAYACIVLASKENVIKSKVQILGMMAAGYLAGMALMLFVVYKGDIGLLFHFIKGSYYLVVGYGEAMCLWPNSDPFKWVAAWVALLGLPLLLRKDKDVLIYYALMIGPLFFAWKHGIGRQENSHYFIFYHYLFSFFGGLLLLSNTWRWQIPLAGVLTIMALESNMKLMANYSPQPTVWHRWGDWNKCILEFETYRLECRKETAELIKNTRIPAELALPNTSATVDAIPNELVFIGINRLNYRPKPMLQLGAFHPWLDATQAAHFSSAKAPDYIYWQLSPNDRFSEFSSVDDKYSLNDDPQTLAAISRHYEIIARKEQLILLKKRTTPLPQPTEKLVSTSKTPWNEWMDVPANATKLKLNTPKSWSGKLLSATFRPPQYFVEYALEDGRIYKHRFLPAMAKEGLSLEYLTHLEDSLGQSLVQKVRFSAHPAFMVAGEIEATAYECTPLLRGLATSVSPKYRTILETTNDFEGQVRYWDGTAALTTANAYQSKLALHLDSLHQFSPFAKFKVSELNAFKQPQENFVIQCVLYAKMSEGDPVLVVEVKDGDKSLFWNGTKIRNHCDEIASWHPASTRTALPKNLPETATINVYVWNPSGKVMDMDKFKVTVKAIENGQ